MRRTLIVELKNFINKDVKVQGWVQTIRDQKEVQFIVVRDHTGLIQFVLERSKNAKLAEEVSNLTTESAVTLIGRVVENPIVKLGGFEVQLHDLRVESSASLPLPFDLFGRVQPDLDKRLDWRFLDLRQPNNFFIFRVQTTLEMGMREYWYSQGFIEIHSPKLMGSESESRADYLN